MLGAFKDAVWSGSSATYNDKNSIANDDNDEPPAFPLPNSIQRAGASARDVDADEEGSLSFNVSPPSPTASTSSSSASTPRVSLPSFEISTTGATKPKPQPSHRPFAAEPENVIKPARQSGLALPPSTTAIPPRRNKKVALKPGYSALDWARLSKESGDELRAGYDSPARITMSEVAEHTRRNDAWSVFHGKVYNISPYLLFHPGGASELMRVAGRDGTELFMKTHGWVNADLMMEACLIGYLVSG